MSELAILRETLQFYDQISSEKTMAVELALNCYNERCALFADLMALVQKHSDLISKDQIEQLIANEQNYRFDAVATQRAFMAFAMGQRGRPFLPMVPAVLASFTLLAAMFLFVLAFLAWALGRLLHRGPPVMPRFRLLPNLIAWLLACGLTSLYLGAMPARVFSLQTGTRVSTIVVYTIVFLIPLFLALGRTFHFLRKRQFRFSLVWLLGATAACAFLAALWANLQPFVWQIAQGLPQQQWRMRGGWIGADVDLTRFTDGSSASALTQWLARGGPYFSVVVGMLILMTWFYPRSLVDTGKRFFGGSLRESQEHWAMIIRELARSAALAATCLVIVYLWWTAGFVRIQDRGYQETMRGIRTPGAFADQLDQARTQEVMVDDRNFVSPTALSLTIRAAWRLTPRSLAEMCWSGGFSGEMGVVQLAGRPRGSR